MVPVLCVGNTVVRVCACKLSSLRRSQCQSLHHHRASVLETLIDNLDNRFPQSGMTILSALGDIFDVKLYPSQNLQQHATVALETILERYSPDSMDRVLIERNRTRRHFSEFKLRPCQLHAGVQTCDFESIRNLPRLCCACTHLHHHPNQLCSL